MCALAIALVAGLFAGTARAQGVAADSTTLGPTPRDSLAKVRASEKGSIQVIGARDTAATRRGAAAPVPRFDRPRWVMLRSLAVPGWGQLHNGSWLKAAGVAVGEVWLGYQVIDDQRKLRQLNEAVELAQAAGDDALQEQRVNEYNARLDHSVSRQWLLGGVVAYALLDAYIDAHFRNFKMDFEIDPALPDGPSESGVRVSLRGNF